NQFALARNIGLSEAFSQDGLLPLVAIAADTDDPQRMGRQPVVVSDVQSYEDISAEYRAIMLREGKHAWFEFILMSGDEPKGIIVALYDQPRTFSGEELELIRTFAVQAALAIHNAQLYSTVDLALDRRVNQLQALYDIGQELTAILNLQKVFDLVVERAVEGTSSDAGLVIVADESGMGIEVVAHRGYPAGTFDSLYLGSGITVTVFDTGKPVVSSDVRQHAQYRALSSTTRSQLSIPVRREGETLGVITVESDALDAYNDDDITYVTQLATQAAIAIDNARLFKLISEGRDRLQVILDSMTDAVLLIDSDGMVALANPCVASLLGLNPIMLVGRLVDDLLVDTGSIFAENLGFPVNDLRLMVADLRAGEWLGNGAVQNSYELQNPHRYIERHVQPVGDKGGSLLGLLMVFTDETEEQELALRRDDLNRMIVHDLRGPLTAVTASFKLLNDLAPADSEFTPIVHRTTAASMQAVRKLLNLVDSLLDIGKMESGQMRLEQSPTHFNAIASNVVMSMDSLARELKVNLAVDVPYDMPSLYVDPDQLERILLNLVDNALKFTPSGGVVMVTAYLPDEQPAPAGFVRIEVSDTGPGIPDEYKERLFNRFQQVEGSRGRRRGTGLGLTFCRLATEAHGGSIWIEDNSDGGGAIFAFTLPVATDLPVGEEDFDRLDNEFDGQ
ncbi:ATP-binding protein, partial [Chloroflexota bacterium]